MTSFQQRVGRPKAPETYRTEKEEEKKTTSPYGGFNAKNSQNVDRFLRKLTKRLL